MFDMTLFSKDLTGEVFNAFINVIPNFYSRKAFLVSVREMLRLILKESSFLFNGKHYQ